jgi:hypothetical protein
MASAWSAVVIGLDSLIAQREKETPQPYEERHYPVMYWARRWGFSAKTVREWFRDESGPGILRQINKGRRSKRDYVTVMISASAVARVYAKRTGSKVVP